MTMEEVEYQLALERTCHNLDSKLRIVDDENAVLREIATAAAADDGPMVQDTEFMHWTCGLCYETADWQPRSKDGGRSAIIHAPTCPVTKARTFLADHPLRAKE